MKILIATNSGFQVRYLLQTDIYKRFIQQNIDISVMAFPNEIDLIKQITNEKLILYQSQKDQRKILLKKYLEYMRFFTRAQYNSTSVEIYKRMYSLGTSPIRKLGIFLLFLISNLIKKSKLF